MATQLVLFDISEAMVDTWSEAFLDGMFESEHVAIRQATLEEIKDCDVLVLPGNSYGVTSGDLNLAALRIFGEALEETVQRIIETYYLGELPVGSAFPANVEDDSHSSFRSVIYTPIMRTPTTLRGTENPYLATLAALQVVNSNQVLGHLPDEEIKVAMPAMGMGHGKLPVEVIASQMKAAWGKFQDGQLPGEFTEVIKRDFHI